MPLAQGEVYHCPDTQCGCEVTVTSRRCLTVLTRKP